MNDGGIGSDNVYLKEVAKDVSLGDPRCMFRCGGCTVRAPSQSPGQPNSDGGSEILYLILALPSIDKLILDPSDAEIVECGQIALAFLPMLQPIAPPRLPERSHSVSYRVNVVAEIISPLVNMS